MSKYEKVRVSMRNYEKGPRTYAKVPLVLLLLLLPPPLLLLLPALLPLLLPPPLVLLLPPPLLLLLLLPPPLVLLLPPPLVLLLPPPLLLLLPALLLLLLPSPLLHMWLKFTEVHETVRDTRAVVPRFGTQSSIKCPGIALRVGAIGARRPRSLRLRP